MKRMTMYFLIIVCLLINFSCGGMKVVRTVQDDNIFYSSFLPEIKIKISPDFKYYTKKEKIDQTFDYFDSEKTSNVEVDEYFFIDTLSEKPKTVLINISKLTLPNWEFRATLFENKNTFESGTVKIHGVRYKYSVWAASQPDGFFLVRNLGRRLGTGNNVLIVISYIEKVTGDWSNIKMLSTEQNKYLQEFIDASKKDIQILE